MSDFEGQIWAAQDNDVLNLVCVTKRHKNKIQVLNDKGKEQRLSEEKLIWQYTHNAKTANDWQSNVNDLYQKINELQADIDITLLWESALELEVSDIEEMADLYFGGEIGTEHYVALWYGLVADKLHFKRKGKQWEPRTQTQIDELLLQRQREAEREQAQELAQTWLQKAAKSVEDQKNIHPEEEILPFVNRIEAWLLRSEGDKDVEKFVTQTADSIRYTPRELAFEILQRCGRLAADVDRDIIISGLKPEFSETVNEAAQQIQSLAPDPATQVTELAFSIDDEDTREVDDALSIQRDGDCWCVTIAIADPATVIHNGDPLDKEAMRRGTTVYLPTQTVLMLPSRISCDIASLSENVVRSSIVLRAWLDDQGELRNSQIQREWIVVKQRLHYFDADDMINAESTDATAQQLSDLHTVALALNAKRHAEGAISLYRQEYKIAIYDGDITVQLIDRNSPSRLLVAEMMILANHIAGKYAYLHQVPLIFRTQDPPLEPIDPITLKDPLAFGKVRKLLRPSSLSLQPGAHHGLGLSVYTQLTSPLRRFADLVMQRQLVANIVGESLPYDQDELFKVLATAERTARDARIVENEAKKRWFMEYLKQKWLEKPIEVLLLEQLKGGYKVQMQPWGVEAFLGTSVTFDLGRPVRAMIDKVRVRAGQVRMKLIPKNTEI